MPRRARSHRGGQRSLNAFNLVARDRALERAAAVDRARAAGASLGPLAGVPIALKDNLCVRGMRTTASSRILEHFVPPYDATVVRAARGGRRDHRRQDQLRRVRDGIVERELGLRAGAESVAHRSHTPGGSSGGLGGRRGRGGACRSRSAPTPAGRSASRHRSAASSGSSRPTAACRATVCWRSPRRSIRSDRSPARSADAALTLVGDRRRRSAPTPRPSREPVPDFARALTGDIRGLRVGVPRTFVSEGVDARS